MADLANKIVLLGPPASGKGTQARKLASHYNAPCLSTGKLLRDEISKGSEVGRVASDYITRGMYVPDALILSMVETWLSNHQGSWILDGFPRTAVQANVLNKIAKPDVVIALEVPQQELEFRVTKRRECNQCGATVSVESASIVDCPECKDGHLISRTDDTLSSFKARYEHYSSKTMPLLQLYSDLELLQMIDGTQLPDRVFDSILELFSPK